MLTETLEKGDSIVLYKYGKLLSGFFWVENPWRCTGNEAFLRDSFPVRPPTNTIKKVLPNSRKEGEVMEKRHTSLDFSNTIIPITIIPPH